ncbi:EAL domain-containing protein [Luteimonas yindakuii]|uniref:EAL domain-containing protein n=1 Tax=Luteimonas yindakuii TaxID=2565782 RepID=A0A4Z1RED1_9GAMM|nr:EAL domain-containing protein [Luteimonas yindakuii]QCU72355.1 EAL domain-containing protein [Luteimonas yindakuii]TKS53027.1 EAL domain-containing protein [Luteimonas yindakuii]
MSSTTSCDACGEGRALPMPIAMAFQPIVDLASGEVHAYEALVRGADGASAFTVLAAIPDDRLYAFDQACRVTAIETAAALGMRQTLSINFLPNAVYQPENCIRRTLAAARRADWPLERILFEVAEREHVARPQHLLDILGAYRSMGFRTAIDDFGAGYAGLNLLAAFQPDLVKLDMALVRGIDGDRARRIIVDHATRMCVALGVAVVAEGVETRDEAAALRDLGIDLQQGYLYARPQLGALPEPVFAA